MTCITKGETVYRLPYSIKPISYSLSLKPDLMNADYNGTVDIRFIVRNETRCIVLNAEDLNFGKNDVQLFEYRTNTRISLVSFKLDTHYHLLYLKYNRVFQVGEEFVLKIAFNAKLRNDLRGFYKSTYTRNGVTKVLATTHFEPEDARTAFPCFDVPDLKANFTISITLKPEDASNEKMKVLSNMPEAVRTALPDGSSVVLFQESPPMSTYLVAFIVGEFDYVETIQDGIVFRVYTLPGDSEKGLFQLDVAWKVTKFFGDYFGVKYALPKMDLIGIPDFRAGAMENYGLITFRATYLLVDNTTTQSQKEAWAEVVAHEIAHQWSGNYITCAWWHHIWLNEGFATFFETLALDAIYPEYNRWQAKLTNSIQYALIADALPSSHPIVNNATTPLEIDEVFDTITYDKGGAFLYMLYNSLGPQKFQAWMRAYFSKFPFGNAVTPQLLEVLESTVADAGVTMAQLSVWTNQPGFPVVTVKQQGPEGTYLLEQKRFYSNKPMNTTIDPVWWIPVTILHSDGQVQYIEFTEKVMNNVIRVPAGDWIKLNNKQNAFYRVNYTRELWTAIFQQIGQHNPLLSVGDRFGVVDDLFSLSFAGDLSVTDALQLVSNLKTENTFVVWDALMSHLNRISALIAKEPIYFNYKRLVIDLVRQKYEQLGWDPKPSDTNDDIKLRSLLLSTVTGYGLNSSIQEALHRYQMFVQDEVANNIPSELRLIIYKVVVNEQGERGYNQILARLQVATNQSDFNEANRCMYALAWARDPALISNTLELSLTPLIRSQDTVYLIREVSRNPFGTDIAWDFVRQYYDLIVDKVGQRTASTTLVIGTTSRFTTRTKYNEVKSFFEMRSKTKSLDETLDTILTNEQFLKNNYQSLRNYLQANFPYQ